MLMVLASLGKPSKTIIATAGASYNWQAIGVCTARVLVAAHVCARQIALLTLSARHTCVIIMSLTRLSNGSTCAGIKVITQVNGCRTAARATAGDSD